MPRREQSPLTDEQKDLLRSKFVKMCPLKNACTYCSKIVSSDHIARWASHFRACKKVNEADKRAYYALGSDPMPASKRKAFQQPMAQPYSDMMGIELVLHASLLQNMGEDTRKSAKKNKNLSSKMDAQERAEELADNNFNVPDSVSDAGYSESVTKSPVEEEIDTEFAEALAQAKSVLATAEKEKATVKATIQKQDLMPVEKYEGSKIMSIETAVKEKATAKADNQEQDSMSTEKDEDSNINSIRAAGFSTETTKKATNSPLSDTFTDEELITVSANEKPVANDISETIFLKKAPLAPVPEC